MKRLLFAFILIGTSFACKAMSDEEKFEEIRNHKFPNITLSQVEELEHNQYVQNNPQQLIEYALSLQGTILSSSTMKGYTLKLQELTPEAARRVDPDDITYGEACLAQFKIIEIARQLGVASDLDVSKFATDPIADRKNIIDQQLGWIENLKNNPEPISITSNGFILKGVGIAAVLIAAYFGWQSCCKHSKNDNKAS